MNLQKLLIETEQSLSVIRLLNEDIAVCERVHTYTNSNQVDAFGPFWSLVLADLKPGDVSIRVGESYVDLKGPMAIFIPAFKIVQWRIRPGTLRWNSIGSVHRLSEEINDIRILPLKKLSLPETLASLSELLRQILAGGTVIPEQSKCSALSERLKNHIELSFRERQRLVACSGLQKYSQPLLNRDFKKTYGITPGMYRHRLRLFEGIHLMKEVSVLDATLAVGYADPGQFITQFQKYLGTSPKQYRKGKLLFKSKTSKPIRAD